MAPTARASACLLLTAALATGFVSGCASAGGSRRAPPRAARQAPERFPAAAGRTVQDLRARYPQGPILAPSVSVLERGINRVGFALFDRARGQLAAASAALYTASPDGKDLRGPFPVRLESLAVAPAFRSRTAARDPDAARWVYVARVPFRRPGRRILLALARLDGRVVVSTVAPAAVGAARSGPPRVGQPAIRIHTPTVADVHGRLGRIDTRVPPAPALARVDFADVLGHRPVVLVFATPQLCQSRVCGPVVDAEAEVQRRLGSRAAFIHMEVFRGNDPNRGYRPQFLAWRLPSEPWAFAIDRAGRIVARLEGAFSVAELQHAAERAIAAR